MELRFDKYEGLGNDFLVVDQDGDEAPVTPDMAIRLCDRHRGVGADGVLLTGVVDGQPFMKVLNADGSVPQMCGNGVRCVALHLSARGHVGAEPFLLRTDAGPHRVRVHRGEPDGWVEVWMRPASLRPADLPLRSERPWIDEPAAVESQTARWTAVSMGNPHVVTFDDVGSAAEQIGRALQDDPRFPEKVNVGFAAAAAGGFDLRVWERGVGWTQACGTGACAAAVAAVETGRAERHAELSIRLPGGELLVRVEGEDAPVRMSGPARRVFRGVLPTG